MSRLLGMVIVSASLYISEERQGVRSLNYIAGVEFVLWLRLPCRIHAPSSLNFGPV